MLAKAFNLGGAEEVTVAGQTISSLQLGDSGRGRLLTKVQCPTGIVDNELVEVSLSETKPSGLKTKPKVNKVEGQMNFELSQWWVARISTQAAYVRGANGNVSHDMSDTDKSPVLVAKGYGAFGDAGRIGTWDDILCLVHDGTILRVKPSRGDAYYLLFAEDAVWTVSADDLPLLGKEFDSENRTRL